MHDNFNCPHGADDKSALMRRVLAALAAKAVAYPLLNVPHLLGPLFVNLSEVEDGATWSANLERHKKWRAWTLLMDAAPLVADVIKANEGMLMVV